MWLISCNSHSFKTISQGGWSMSKRNALSRPPSRESIMNRFHPTFLNPSRIRKSIFRSPGRSNLRMIDARHSWCWRVMSLRWVACSCSPFDKERKLIDCVSTIARSQNFYTLPSKMHLWHFLMPTSRISQNTIKPHDRVKHQSSNGKYFVITWINESVFTSRSMCLLWDPSHILMMPMISLGIGRYPLCPYIFRNLFALLWKR